MNYHNITKDDMNNGDGLRVVLWVAGCPHHCPECQNPQTWDYDSGIQFDDSALAELRYELRKDYISGITLSGGDPLAPKNRYTVLKIVEWVKRTFPTKTIWLYTGYKYDALIFEGNYEAVQIIRNCDVIVDGEYKKDLRDVNLKWKGSKNQRVINVQESLRTGGIVLHTQ